MNQAKIQNLKIKVLEAKNLNVEEKSEWLVLLDLMNERQMADLEEILKNLASKSIEEKQSSPKQEHPSFEQEKNIQNAKSLSTKKHHFILPKDGFFLPVPFPIPVPRPPRKSMTELNAYSDRMSQDNAQDNLSVQSHLSKKNNTKALPLPKFTTISYTPIQDQKTLANKPSEFFKSLKNILGKKELPKPKITSISYEQARAEKAMAQMQENAKHPNIFKHTLNRALAHKELPKPKITSISYEGVRVEKAIANLQQKQTGKAAVSGFFANLKNILNRKELTKPSIDAIAKKQSNIPTTLKENTSNLTAAQMPATTKNEILEFQTQGSNNNATGSASDTKENITIVHTQQAKPGQQNLEKTFEQKNENQVTLNQADQKPSSFLKSLKNIIISSDLQDTTENSPLFKKELLTVKPKTNITNDALKLTVQSATENQGSEFETRFDSLEKNHSTLTAENSVAEKPAQDGITLQAIIKPQFIKMPEKKSEVDIALDKVIAKQKARAKTGDFSPGLKLEGVMLGEHQDAILNLKEQIAEKNAKTPQAKKPTPGKRSLASIALDNILDLSVLELRDLKTYQPSVLLEKIVKLIMENGYFNVIFQLEKSPLFTAYINTGLKLLAEKTDFDNLKFNNDEQIMSKSEFEEFVDILRRLQGEKISQEED